MGGKQGLKIPRRVRENHGSMLVTIPPDIADLAGIKVGDYVVVEYHRGMRKIVLRKMQ